MSINIGEVETFPDVEPDKAQALKVVEEAAEVFSAWQAWKAASNDIEWCDNSFRLLAECADVIQATCNLLAALGYSDFEPHMDACAERNRERGRM